MGEAISDVKRAWLDQLHTMMGGAAVVDAGAKEHVAHVTHAANAKARAKAPAKLEYNNYVALINGINHLVLNYRKPGGALDVSPSDDRDLVKKHRDMLLNFNTALILVKSDPGTAFSLWERTSPGLRQELATSTAAGPSGADAIAQLDFVQKYFDAAGYGDAKRKAQADSSLEAPNTAQLAVKLEKAEAELNEAKELFEQGTKLAKSLGKLAGTEAPSDVVEIIEMVRLPGSIEEKLAYAKKHGIAGTAAELVGKVTGATGTLIKTVGETGEKVIEARRAIVLGRTSTKATIEAAEKLEQVAGKFKKLANLGKALGTAASYAAVIADGIKLVSAVADGDYDEALKAGTDLAIDAAPLVLGADVAAPLAMVVVVIKAELETWKLAAAFIRYCKDEMVRQAAADFVRVCTLVEPSARALVADCELLTGSAPASIQETALKQANKEAEQVSKGLNALASHVASRGTDAIGAYPPVVAALGRPAISAMSEAFNDRSNVLTVADNVAAVFKGANAMVKYVGENYKN